MDWLAIVQTVGFPIAMVGACAWLIFYMYKAQLEDKEKLYIELGKSREANDKFADIISNYTAKLDGIQEDVKEIKSKVGA